MGKIVSKDEYAKEIKKRLKAENKTVVLCHGVFDLVHPGHIMHFKQAKSMGDVLVVSVTSEKYVRKGPGRPYFNDELRMKFLESIEIIDYVMLSEGYTVDDIVEAVEPDVYVKGEEYSRPQNDITGKISEEKDLVEKHGGQVKYTQGQVFSSTKLINTMMSGLSDDVRQYMENFKKKHSLQDIKNYSEKVGTLKVLVIGDVIIDKYIYCSMQGLMSKDMGYSARFVGSEEYLGGALAVAGHLASFTENVTLMSILGNEAEIHSRILNELGDRMHLDLCFSDAFSTIEKKRYVVRNDKREELRKIFAINNIKENKIGDMAAKKALYGKAMDRMKEFDMVVVCDFGHGLLDDGLIRGIQEKAGFVALNCQTNSSNYGMNIITKYGRADAFCLDQKELKLAFPSYDLTEEDALRRLSRHLGGSGWLTRGSKGAYGVGQDDGEIDDCPAFSLNVRDTVGAGDAFFAIASAFAAAGAPTEVGTFIGNVSGALAANIVGNREPLCKVDVMKYAATLMNV